jgi:D-arabinose 1-dehydrogenase-like Zn-dependent alcohol dehydrogenase
MGSYMGSLNEFKELMAMATSKRLNLLPTVTYGLDQANDALGELEEGRIVGRAVLTP